MTRRTLATFGLCVGLAACSGKSGAPAAQPAAGAPAQAAPAQTDTVTLTPQAEKQAGIVVSAAKSVMRTDRSQAPGLLALNETRTSRIGSLVEGSVVRIKAQPGERVKAGQVLAEVHSHVVHDSWAGYRKAKADERRLTTEYRYAVDAHARAERLFADKAVALQEVQRAEANRVSALESLDMAKTEVRRAEEELEHLGITNGEDPTGESGEFIPIRTPHAGVLLERLVTEGTAVTPGTQMFVVSDTSSLWALAEIDEPRLSLVRVGRGVSVKVSAYPAETFDGKVTFIAETVNPKTHRITVRCELANGDGRLKPEMYATVDIGESEPHPAIAVPSAAIQTINGKPSVWVQVGPGRFTVRPVEVGRDQDGLVDIRAGLAADERIVTTGAFVLKAELLKSSSAEE